MASVWLDVMGGALSLAQLLLDCAVRRDFSGLRGDPVKLGLGALTLVYDATYIAQNCMYGARLVDSEGEVRVGGTSEAQEPLLLGADGDVVAAKAGDRELRSTKASWLREHAWMRWLLSDVGSR